MKSLLWHGRMARSSLVMCAALLALQVIWMPYGPAQAQGRPTPTPYPTPSTRDYAKLEEMRLPWDTGEIEVRGISDDWVDHCTRTTACNTVGFSWGVSSGCRGRTLCLPRW